MANYTMQVRTICEYYAGLNKEEKPLVGCDYVDDILSKCWNKIFYTESHIQTENNPTLHESLCKKILKHYYAREIGSETAGLWRLWMNRKMEEISGYYSSLYASAEIEINPLYNNDYTETVERQNNIAATDNGNASDTTKAISSSTQANSENYNKSFGENEKTKSKDFHSDTPQGYLQGVESGEYLTDARIVDTDKSIEGSESSTKTGSNTENGNEDVERTSTDIRNKSEVQNGKEVITKKGNAGENESEMLKKYRETIINIDSMVIDEFKNFFMMIW